MQVFRIYFKILKKHMVSVLIYAGLFLFISILITSNIKSGNDKFKPEKVNIMVINEDGKNALTNGFLKYLGDYATFVKPIKGEEARMDALYYGDTEYILTIPKGFSKSFAKGNTVKLEKKTVPNSSEAMSVDNTIDNYFNMAKVYQKHVPNLDYSRMNAYIIANSKDQTKVEMNVKVKDDVTYSNEFNSNFFNYLGYVIIAAYIISVSMILFSFNGIDIRRRQTASPLTSRALNLQLILANLIFVFGYLIMFIIAGCILNKNLQINANTILVWVNAFVFSLTALSISYLIGITVISRKAISALSTAISLSLSFISGIFVPQMYLGKTVLKVASFTPAYWYVKANNALMTVTSFQWNKISDVFGYMAIETGFTIAIISIALVVSKRKRQQAY